MDRSRSRKKLHRNFDPRSSTEEKCPNVEGYIQPRNYNKASKIELDSTFLCDPSTEANSGTFDFMIKTKSPPIRAPPAEEMSRAKQSRRSSPGVIARLMGLDTLPSPGSRKPHREAKFCSKKSSKNLQENLFRHDCALQICNDEHQEFKDVFENMEVAETESLKKQSEMRKAFIRQSFINATHLSADKKLQRSKEFDNALKVFKSNKELFLKLLQEPNSLFSKHFQDHQSPPSPQASSSLILKSLKSETRSKRGIDPLASARQPLNKPAENHSQHREIVILKPNLEMDQKVDQTVRSVNSLCSVKNDLKLSKEEVMKLYIEETGRMKMDTLQMKNASTCRRKASVPSTAIANCSLTSHWGSDNACYTGKSFSPPSPCPFESLVNSEACKHLSKNSRLAVHEIGLSLRESSALSEMIACSDKEVLKRTLDSKDDWKDGFYKNLPRSKSLSVLSRDYENSQLKPSNRLFGSKTGYMTRNNAHLSTNLSHRQSKSKHYSDQKGNRLPVSEIQASSKEFKQKFNAGFLTEDKHALCALSDIFSVPSCNVAVPSLSKKDMGLEKLQNVVWLEKKGRHSKCGNSKELSKKASADRGIDEPFPPSCCMKETDQPSPVSVLELSPKEDKSDSGCFQKIRSDLQELRAQLQLLKLDSANSFTEKIEALFSFDNDDDDADDVFDRSSGGIIEAFRDEDDRDYSYLVDVLIASGLLKSEKSRLIGAFRQAEFPVDADVFLRLESKYERVESWPCPERKLFFDLINSTLADLPASPLMSTGLVEEVWQAVVKLRKEDPVKSAAADWNVGGINDSDVVEIELEGMLCEHLIDQLVTELVYI